MGGFEIDERAFRAQNAARKPGHLVRELIQNSFDEDCSSLSVDVTVDPDGVRVAVEDDVRSGIRNLAEIWTVFSSGKQDDPTKRGRMGRGLKEIIAVCDHAIVDTVGRTVGFKWDGTRFKRTERVNDRKRGTRIVCIMPWRATAAQEITAHLSYFMPPAGIKWFAVNEQEVARRSVIDSFKASLATVIEKDGTMVERIRVGEVRLCSLLPGDEPHVYEMGIPVERIKDDGFPYHIDVQQRLPLRAERDVVPRGYLRTIFALVANRTVKGMTQEEASGLWLEEAISSPAFDKAVAGRAYVESRFGTDAIRAVTNDTQDHNLKAVQEGLTLVKTQEHSPAVRDLLRKHTLTVSEKFRETACDSADVAPKDWTADERRFVGFVEWLGAELGIGQFDISVYEAPKEGYCATWDRWANRVNFNRSRLPNGFFKAGNIEAWVDLCCHEFGHRNGEGHDKEWQDEVSRLAGAAFRVAMEHAVLISEKGWA